MEIEGRRNKKAKTTDCMATNNNVNKSAGSREEQMETGDTSNIDENSEYILHTYFFFFFKVLG